MSKAYLGEIAEQPGILDRLATRFAADYATPLADLAAGLAQGRFDRVIVTGMGGSLHGAYPAFLDLSRRLPLPVLLWDASELSQQVPGVVTPKSLVIAISQSGESGEIKRLTEMAARPAQVLAITNGRDNTLARWSDIGIATEAGPELTASTKTYTAGLAALYLAVAHLSGEGSSAAADVAKTASDAAQLLKCMADQTAEAAAFLGHDAPLVFIGRGPSFASAAMAALLTEEAAKLTCQALTGGQFRHGPLELVREGFRAVVYLGEGPARSLSQQIAQQIAALGGRCLTIGSGTGPLGDGLRHISLPVTPESLLPLPEILPIQHLVIPLAIARGFEPAAFLNARKITTGE